MGKVLFLTSRFPPTTGGAEIYAYDLTNNLKNYDWEATVVTEQNDFIQKKQPYQNYSDLIKISTPIDRIQDPNTVSWRIMKFGLLDNIFKSLPSSVKYDIVHSNSIESSILGRIISDHFGVPLVSTIHEHSPETQSFGFGRCNLIFQRLKVDALIAPSHFYYKRAVKYGFPKNRLHLITHGICNDRLACSNQENLRTQWGETSNKLTFITLIGRIYKPKGIINLVEATRQLKEKNKNFKVIIVGPDGPDDYANSIKNKIIEYNLEKSVILMGEVSPSMIPSIINSTDILVAPSLAEGFGIAVVESMILGTPVIASEVGGLKQIIINNKTGLLVTPGNIFELTDALQKMLDSKELRTKIAKNAKKIALDKFSAKRMAKETAILYKSLI